MPDHPVVASLLRSIDEAYDRRSWHGTNLRGSIRGLDARRAAWRPARGPFSLRGSNWFPSPARPTDAAWKKAVALLATEHRRPRPVIAGLASAGPGPGSRQDPQRLARGIAAHDLYHAGQIQLLKRPMPARRNA